MNFEFSKSFNETIEQKQTAEQKALRAGNVIEVEADQEIAEARGRAESVKLEAAACFFRSITSWTEVIWMSPADSLKSCGF